MTNKKPMGCPTKYSDGLVDFICDLIKEGKTLTEICSMRITDKNGIENDLGAHMSASYGIDVKKLKKMPGMSTISDWLRDKDDFSAKYKASQKESARAIYESGLTRLENTPVAECWMDTRGVVYAKEDVAIMGIAERRELGLQNVGLSPALVSLNKAIFDAKKHFAAIRDPDNYSDKRRVDVSGQIGIKQLLDEMDD